jgi:hypothetical protein
LVAVALSHRVVSVETVVEVPWVCSDDVKSDVCSDVLLLNESDVPSPVELTVSLVGFGENSQYPAPAANTTVIRTIAISFEPFFAK